MKSSGKISFFWLFLCYCSEVIADNIKSSNSQNSEHLRNLTNVVTELLHTTPVYPKTIIIFHEKYDKINSKLLKKLQLKSTVIVLIEKFSNERKIIHTQKIDALLLFIKNYSNEELLKVLRSFSKTPWKNPMPKFFLIIDFLGTCTNAAEILKLTWKFRIVSYFICPSEYKNFWIFTFNPFSRRAPFPWKKVKTIHYLYNDWTLFVREYKKEDIMKNPLDFNRIKVLDGYKLIIGTRLGKEFIKELDKANASTVISQKKQRCNINLWDRNYILAIVMTLNVYVELVCFLDRPTTSNYKKEHIKLLFQSDVDIIGTAFTLKTNKITFYDFEYMFPTYYHQWGILTVNRGHKTPVEKIQDFYGIWVLLYTICILSVTFIVIWLFEQRRTYFAAFEIIRLLIGSGLYTKMETVSLRIFFCAIFIYFLIIQATFNGNLTNFLTKPVLRKHPETLKDLNNLGYDTIYGVHSLNFSMIDNINFTTTTTCWSLLNNKTNAACIDNSYFLRIKTWDKKSLYHVSKKTFGFFFRHYYVHSNWPLIDKVNHIIIRIWESGIRLHWEEEYYSTKLFKAKVDEEKSLFIFAPIQLNNLLFAFIILVTGLICATLTFFIELRCAYKKHIHTTFINKNIL